MPFSSNILRAAGAGGGLSLLASGRGSAAGEGVRSGAGLAAGVDLAAGLAPASGVVIGLDAAGRASLRGFDRGDPAPSLIDPKIEPIATVVPWATLMSAKTPAAGAGTSTVTLSVSSSTSGSSASTASPGFLNHWPTVASVTDSPSAGTTISIAILATLSVGERLGDERLLLLIVLAGEARRRGRRCRAAHVARPRAARLRVLQHPFDVGLDQAPGPHVFGLLLRPHYVGLREPRQLGDEGARRERIELLDAHQIDVVDAGRLARLVEVVVDLAAAQHDAANLLVGPEPDLLARARLRIV